MAGALEHRGPDEFGLYRDPHAGLAHARLSIVDLASGQQPLSNEDGTIWIAADARVDARDDLVRKLTACGRTGLEGANDAELLLHAYGAWGQASVDHLLGDFAFAIWDQTQRILFCARDHFGVKPFYYVHQGRRFAFASEIKALLEVPEVEAQIDPQSLHKYAYGNCDPTNVIDPSGHDGVMIALLVAVAIVAILFVMTVHSIGFLTAGYTANAERMATEPYKSWINSEAKEAGIEPRFLAAILATEILDRDWKDTYGDIWGSILGDSSVGLGQVRPSTAENILHYGHLRSALALWNRKTNIHVTAQYIKSLIDAANDIGDANPDLHFYFDGNPSMTLSQYKQPMATWDEAHKKLLAQQYTQTPWRFDPNAKYGYSAHLSNRATGYYLGFWENYTGSDFVNAFP